MAWYDSKKFWSSLTVILTVGGAFAAIFLGKSDELIEASPFIGSIVGGGVIGYAAGKSSKSK